MPEDLNLTVTVSCTDSATYWRELNALWKEHGVKNIILTTSNLPGDSFLLRATLPNGKQLAEWPMKVRVLPCLKT